MTNKINNLALQMIFSTLFLFIGSEQNFSLRADQAGNGSGFVEEQITFVYWNFDQFAKLALDAGAAYLSTEETETLIQIMNLAPTERRERGFHIAKTNEIPASKKTKLAWTLPKKFAPIYFNQNLLYRSDLKTNALIPAIDTADIAGRLAHEIGHHLELGDESEDFLHGLGGKITFILKQETEEVKLFSKSISVITMHNRGLESVDRLYLNTEEKVFDLTDFAKEKVFCTSYKTKEKKAPIGIRYTNVHWLYDNIAFYQNYHVNPRHSGFQMWVYGICSSTDEYSDVDQLAIAFERPPTSAQEIENWKDTFIQNLKFRVFKCGPFDDCH